MCGAVLCKTRKPALVVHLQSSSSCPHSFRLGLLLPLFSASSASYLREHLYRGLSARYESNRLAGKSYVFSTFCMTPPLSFPSALPVGGSAMEPKSEPASCLRYTRALIRSFSCSAALKFEPFTNSNLSFEVSFGSLRRCGKELS